MTESNGRAPGRGGLPEASLVESVRFVATGLLPSVARGLFSPRRAAMKVLTALDSDRRAIGTLASIREKHGGEGVRLFGGRLVVLWGPQAIRETLDRSADVYAADSGAKGKGMSHFQPDAVTISRGEAWRDRRAFTEAVLATGQRVHPLAERFLGVIDDEVERMHIGATLEWPDWERLFDHVTLRVIFGDGARGDQELTTLLERLMASANRIVGAHERSDDFYEFYGMLERRLRDPQAGSLVSLLDEAPHSDTTRVVHQIPHWMFATRDTLAANTYRALAAIVADRSVEERVREELEGADLADPEAVDGLRYLEGCLQEAMRLWPTTPLLARETTRPTELAGEKLDEGTQVMILNVFNHRDGGVPNADRLDPERWSNGARDYRFNHLSNGSQDCPGGPLVLLLGKGVLARVLSEWTLELERPRLETGGGLPTMLDFFDIRFDAVRRGG